MAKFFTVDRSSDLMVGLELELITDLSTTRTIEISGSLKINELECAFYRNYPNGISRHGQSYLFGYPSFVAQSGHKDYVEISPMVEAIVEQVRRADFPHLTSRMTSMFACQNISDAYKFKNEYHQSQANIFEVESDKYFLGDMSLLSIGGQTMHAFELAYKYWSGDRSDNPFIEVLIPLPVTIGRLVE